MYLLQYTDKRGRRAAIKVTSERLEATVADFRAHGCSAFGWKFLGYDNA